jgi:hypothetical protein
MTETEQQQYLNLKRQVDIALGALQYIQDSVEYSEYSTAQKIAQRTLAQMRDVTFSFSSQELLINLTVAQLEEADKRFMNLRIEFEKVCDVEFGKLRRRLEALLGK